MIITLENITDIDLSSYIGVISNKEVQMGKHFILLKDIDIQLSNNEHILIPKGFDFDGSSTGLLASLLPKVGSQMFAALIHDWMYVTDYRREELGTRKAKRFADKEMFIWSKKLNKGSFGQRLDNRLRYWGVYLFGLRIYKR